jgi:hypothetical protein
MKCCICNKEIDKQGAWTQGHNAMPVKDGRCCSSCNSDIVIPERLVRISDI